MARIRSYPAEKVDYLSSLCGTITCAAIDGTITTICGTVTTIDIVGITSDQKFQEKLVWQELIKTSDGLFVYNYRLDENDLGYGYPINQDVLKITVHGSTACITHLHSENNVEHWLAKLPERVCRQLGCDSCALSISESTVPSCLVPRIPQSMSWYIGR